MIIKNCINKKNVVNEKKYYMLYTLIFCVLALVVFFPFIKENKSFIWKSDGINQHFQAVQYFGEYIRGIIKEFLISGKVIFPMWDLKVGAGLDIISSLNYYAIGDPLNLMYLITPSRYTEYMYEFLIILRLYLSGITFSLYASKMKKEKYCILLGSFIYVFCAFSLRASVRHPFFINPMIYFPLILIGIEKIFRKEKPWIFIFTITISAFNSFYFLYMCTILAVFYALLRFLSTFRDNKNEIMKELLLTIGKFLYYYILGIGLAAVVFIPSIVGLFGTSRVTGFTKENLLFYDFSYYIKFFTQFLTVDSVGSWTYLGYCSISLVCIIFIFIKKNKKYRMKRIMFIIFTMFALIPFMGYLFNGFAYVTNRWIFVYSFFIAYLTTDITPDLFKSDEYVNKKLFFCLILYSTISIITFMKTGKSNILLAVIFLFICNIIIIILHKEPKILKICLVLLISVETILHGFTIYSLDGIGYVNQFIDFGEGNSYITKSTYDTEKYIKSIDDESIFRIDVVESGIENYGLTQDVNSVNSYFSILNGTITDYSRSIGNLAMKTSIKLKSLDSRTILNTLSSVKYMVVKEKDLWKIPYGYEKIKTYKYSDENVYIVKNNNYLPIMYTYSSYIPIDTYNSLEVNEREQSMIEGVVLEENIDLPKTQLEFDYKTILEKKELLNQFEQSKAYKEGLIEVYDNRIVVKKANQSISLRVNGVDNSETYLVWNNIDYIDKNKNKLIGKIDVKTDNGKKKYEICDKRYFASANIEDILMNIGFLEKSVNKIDIKFNNIGEYYFDDLKIICQPMENYKSKVNLLNEKIEDIQIDSNYIKATVNNDENKILCVSIPYSKGWSAKINGEKVKILKSNIMHMGIVLEPGINNIELYYCTPGIKMGLVITIVCIILILFLVLKDRRIYKLSLK